MNKTRATGTFSPLAPARSRLRREGEPGALWVALILIMNSILSAPAGEPFRKTLTSAERGIHLQTVEITARDVPGVAGNWSIRKTELVGGKQEGVDLITVDNGKLKFAVIPTRGMSVLKVEMGSTRLGWDSPVKEVVHPKFINLQSRGGLGWLEGFNEWMVRCGLEFAGHPGKDKFINNVGDEAEMDLTLHGKIGNIPASEVEVVIDSEPPHRLRVRGRVDERMFYGPKLQLWTEISTEPGSSEFRIDDEVKNFGAFDQEFQVIYHANHGPPLLGQGSHFRGALKRVTPFNAHAAKSVTRYSEYPDPAKGFIEQVYCLEPYADEQGQSLLLLENAAREEALSIRFSVKQLPYVTLWKNCNAVEEGYVTGLEPGTGFPFNRRIERKAGRVPKMAAGESRRFTIDIAIHQSRASVEQVSKLIEGIQRGRKTQIDTEPFAVE
jgi:hypothetical protein